MIYRVNELAKLAGISVRTLRYYDQVGLLSPKRSRDSEYRLYDDGEVKRLMQILFLKELDFSLKEIQKILQSTEEQDIFFRKQRALLVEKKNRLEGIIQSLDEMTKSKKGVDVMEKMIKAFDMSEIEAHKKKYAEQVKKQYGNTEAYRESEERTKKYKEKDWERIIDEGNEFFRSLAKLMDLEPGDAEVQNCVEGYRSYITRSFYQCHIDIFRGLGQLYVTDPKFTANINQHGDGLAEFLSQAIAIYCE
ncbi:MerR family transcriptional regulator [Gottschalkiaceae bacterium SANA]|nr:MerR family transcriptional regulator [Gottschalkiaceae bacterium SANA]